MMHLELPDWLPWWAPIVIIVPLALCALALLLMPFSVFGVKGRLDEIQQRLDDIQTEIRSLALRLPDPGYASLLRSEDDGLYAHPPVATPSRSTYVDPPPIPPAVSSVPPPNAPPPMAHRIPVAAPRPAASTSAGRAEPRLDWPRNR